MRKIAIYGAGGFGKEIYCLIQEINRHQMQWDFIGYFDDAKVPGEQIYHGCVLGGMKELNAFPEELGIVFAIGSPKTLNKLVHGVQNKKVFFPNLIAPDFRVLDQDTFNIGHGNLIFSKSSVSCFVEIGDFNILNSLIAIGHDSKIGNCNVFMSGTRISGEVNIGDNNFFGIYSVVLQRIVVGKNTVIGTSSVITNNPKDDTTYIGNPAKKFEY